jgi:UDP-2-acetamido-2,6-beta-L-arabino-hexul-4-ose reductase
VTKVLITGARGFIGRNLVARLGPREDLELFLFDLDNDDEELDQWLASADVVIHLAGVNRPLTDGDFETGNAGFTERLCETIKSRGAPPKMVMTSSVQATRDNPYGRSKLRAEEALRALSRDTGAPVSIYRLKNVFGKWCRPDYNSVTATFCHNIARDLPITISDPAHEIDLVYIDDVVEALVAEIGDPVSASCARHRPEALPSYRITLGDLAGRIQSFHEMRHSLTTPDFRVRFNQCLYGTFLTYRPLEDLSYRLGVRADSRGSLAEFMKSAHAGQVFVSRTRPGVTRGNHYHHTKAEKFLVLHGVGLIRMRPVGSSSVSEIRVDGGSFTVVDIPPGVAHSIENVGGGDMITLFWASELFDPDRPDTYYLAV